MGWWIIVVSGLVAYLLGSVSFSRIVAHLVAPDMDMDAPLSLGSEDDPEAFQMSAVSASKVGASLGDRWGCLSASLDILKALVPVIATMLVTRALYTEPYPPFHLVPAVTALVGHCWPIYYGFKGGRGMSTMMGGLFVVAPLGMVVVQVVGMGLGMFVLKNSYATYLLWVFLIVPWLFIVKDWIHGLFGLAMVAIFVLAMVPEFKEAVRRRKMGERRKHKPGYENPIPMVRHIERLRRRMTGQPQASEEVLDPAEVGPESEEVRDDQAAL